MIYITSHIYIIGLEPSFSYLLNDLNSIYQGRLNISDYTSYDEVSLTIQLVNKKIYDFNIANNNYIIDSLSTKNKISLSASLILAIFLALLLILIYWFLIEKYLKKQLIDVRKMLKLISITFLAKSAKFKKYLVNTSAQHKKTKI